MKNLYSNRFFRQKKFFKYIALIFVLLLSQCTDSKTPVDIGDRLNLDTPPKQIAIKTDDKSTKTVVPTKELKPTGGFLRTTPEITKPPTQEKTKPVTLPTVSLDEENLERIFRSYPDITGKLWVQVYENYLYKESKFLVIDFDEGIFYELMDAPVECNHNPIPNTLWVICGSSNYYLYNLFSSETQPLHLADIEAIWDLPWHPEKFFYSISTGENSWALFEFILLDMEAHRLAELSIDGLESLPLLSPDGNHLIALNNSQIVEIEMNSGKISPITPVSQNVTMNIGFSPINSQVVYGVTNLEIEIGEMANFVYMLDLDNYREVLLSTPPPNNKVFNEFEWPIWSHDGQKVAIVSGSAICIINLITDKVDCTYLNVPENAPYYGVHFLNWSPDDQYITFTEENPDYPPERLLIYSLKEKKIQVLLNNMNLGILFWR